MDKMLEMLRDAKTIAILCNQWGDTGKGKLVDRFASWADIIIRGTGGDNCGHTVCHNGKENTFHALPSGMLYDDEEKTNIIGSGVVAYPKIICREIALLREDSLSYNNLKISLNAKLILPTHIVLDRISESQAKSGKIGTTGRGIGPAYGDHILRIGLTINDLLNVDIFAEKLKKNIEYHKLLLRNYSPESLEAVMNHEHLESGLYYDEKEIFNIDAIIAKYMEYAEELRPLIADTDSLVRGLLGKKNILLEGAQGVMLSIDRGSYPYVTSSDCALDGLAKGAGLKESDVDLCLGIAKFPYMTRVGEGPFPTELGSEFSDKWCNGGVANKRAELKRFGLQLVSRNLVASIEAQEFLQGLGIRQAGNEYGATTKRPRRTGWFDLPLLKYAMQFSSHDLVLTKIDVLNDCDVIRICDQYEYQGPDYLYGERLLKSGDILEEAIAASEVLKHCKPLYREFPGWKCSLAGIKDFKGLPSELKAILAFVISQTNARIRIISTGPDREETIFI